MTAGNTPLKRGGWKKAYDYTGNVYGCLTVISKAASRIVPSKGTKAYWNVRCVCGHEKQMQASYLAKHKHHTCGNAHCTQRWVAPTDVVCDSCGKVYIVQRRATLEKCKTRRCPSCRGSESSTLRGRPAHNRLDGTEGNLRNLFGRYLKSARDRGIAFDLSIHEFRVLTSSDCFYCGAPPSQIMCHRSKVSPPYIYNGVDRVSSQLGYEAGNVEPCCGPCNYMKSDSTIEDFIARAKAIAKRAVEREQTRRASTLLFKP